MHPKTEPAQLIAADILMGAADDIRRAADARGLNLDTTRDTDDTLTPEQREEVMSLAVAVAALAAMLAIQAREAKRPGGA